MSRTKAELIFERWSADLKNKDRSTKGLSSNFDELFEDLQKSGAEFQEAHDILPRAIKAHLPTPGLVRILYKEYRKNPKNLLTDKEYTDGWHKTIADAATESFFVFFPLPKEEDDDDPEPKIYGNMSAREYQLQRRYAESFPRLDTTELEKRLHGDVYNPVEADLLSVLGKDDGETN